MRTSVVFQLALQCSAMERAISTGLKAHPWAEIQHPKGWCMELGNWPIKVQLGSTNSKGLPVLFQGSHQGSFLNKCHYPLSAVPTATSILSNADSHPIRSTIPHQLSCCVLSPPPRPSIQHNAMPINQSIRPNLAPKCHLSSLRTPSIVASQAPRRALPRPRLHLAPQAMQTRSACTSVELPSCQHGRTHDG